jgi:hypothetical protein
MADRLLARRINVTDTGGEFVMDGVSGDSQTVISVSICEIAAAAEVFNLWVSVAGGGTPFYIYKNQDIAANATFIHNDKIVIDDTDELWCSVASGTGSLDVIVSYLQQDDA